MNAIPEAVEIYKKYKEEGVRVLGIATAFEDFDKNTLENLKMLVETGEVIGETKKSTFNVREIKRRKQVTFQNSISFRNGPTDQS